MRAYLARRVVQALVVLVLVSLGGFTVLHLAPGGPVAIYAMSPTMSAEDMERLTRQLGLDQPLHVQYAKWAGGLVTAHWGRSYRDGRVVLEVIADRIPRSEEHTSELQSRLHLVCRLLLEKKKKKASCTG